MNEMMQKALGRCARRHANVVEYPSGEMPAGTCKCGEALIEWAMKASSAKEKA